MEQMWERQKNILYTKAFSEAEKIDQSLKLLGKRKGTMTQNAVRLWLVNFWRHSHGKLHKDRLMRKTAASPLVITMDPGTSFHALGLPKQSVSKPRLLWVF